MSGVDPPVGALVEISTGKGIVRFCGTTSFAPGKWVGIELFEPKGKNDGSIQGIAYFSCKPLHGVFIRPSQVKVLQAEPEQPPPNVSFCGLAHSNHSSRVASPASFSRPSAYLQHWSRPSHPITLRSYKCYFLLPLVQPR